MKMNHVALPPLAAPGPISDAVVFTAKLIPKPVLVFQLAICVAIMSCPVVPKFGSMNTFTVAPIFQTLDAP